jgi:hypothetical protein
MIGMLISSAEDRGSISNWVKATYKLGICPFSAKCSIQY